MRRQPNEAKTELAFADKRLRRIALRMKAWIRYGTIYIDVSVCCEFTLNEKNKAGSVLMAELSVTALLWNATNQGRKGKSYSLRLRACLIEWKPLQIYVHDFLNTSCLFQPFLCQ